MQVPDQRQKDTLFNALNWTAAPTTSSRGAAARQATDANPDSSMGHTGGGATAAVASNIWAVICHPNWPRSAHDATGLSRQWQTGSANCSPRPRNSSGRPRRFTACTTTRRCCQATRRYLLVAWQHRLVVVQAVKRLGLPLDFRG